MLYGRPLHISLYGMCSFERAQGSEVVHYRPYHMYPIVLALYHIQNSIAGLNQSSLLYNNQSEHFIGVVIALSLD